MSWDGAFSPSSASSSEPPCLSSDLVLLRLSCTCSGMVCLTGPADEESGWISWLRAASSTIRLGCCSSISLSIILSAPLMTSSSSSSSLMNSASSAWKRSYSLASARFERLSAKKWILKNSFSDLCNKSYLLLCIWLSSPATSFFCNWKNSYFCFVYCKGRMSARKKLIASVCELNEACLVE